MNKVLSYTLIGLLIFFNPPISFGMNVFINDQGGEKYSYSRIKAEVINRGGYCKVNVLVIDDTKIISNNELIKENSPVNIEVLLFKNGYITGSENIITYWSKNRYGVLEANGETIFEDQNDRTCIVSNVSIGGYPVSKTTINGGWNTTISFPNGEIKPGPLRNPHTVAPILSSVFLHRMQGDYSDDYIDRIPNNIGLNDFRLRSSNNSVNYSKLLRKVLKGETGISGTTPAGYSLDFLKIKTPLGINEFLLESIIKPAINLGMIDSSLANNDFANLLRKYILAEMMQDSNYEYGSEENLKASIALQYSKNITPSIQLHDGDYFNKVLHGDYLLKEYDAVVNDYNSLSKRITIESDSPSDLTVAVYDLPFDIKKWDSSKKGNVGDLYINENKETGFTDIFRLKNEKYGYFPTGSYSNMDWDYIGPKPIGLAGQKGDIYYSRSIYTNEVNLYRLIGDWRGDAPEEKKTNKNWEYIAPYSSLNNMVNIPPEEALEFAKLSNQFGDLEGIELARKVLTQSGKIGIDEENKIIYSSHKLGGLLGYNLAEIASLAYNVDAQDLTATQVMFVKYALDNLAIDTMYPYGSLNNVKATILNRVAITTMDDALIQELGTGAEPFILDQLILNNKKYTTLNFENLVKDYIYLNFKHNGLLVKTDSNSTVDDSAIKQSLYQGLLDLDEVQSKLSEHFSLVAYDNNEKVEALPITDELFARAQLFKYGLSSDMVEDLWKPYLKKGYLRNIHDSRITNSHLHNERKYANKPVQDMWSDNFNNLVSIASQYLATAIDYRLKLLGKEPINGRKISDTTLRLAFGLEIDEVIKSKYFNGIWYNWVETPNNWVIYGPGIDYSIKTANNIIDFMSFSDIAIGEKLPFTGNQVYGNKLRDFPVYKAMHADKAEEFCRKYEWQGPINTVKLGALGLKNVKYECGVQYITRRSRVDSIKDSFEHIIAEMMRTKKWDLKTVQTDRDILYMVLQMFIPLWGTVDSFQKGDKEGGVTGLFGDYMFFYGVAGGVVSSLKPTVTLSKVPNRLISKGVGIALKNGDNVAGAVVRVNKTAAKITARKVIKAVAKSTMAELNPLSGLGDLAVNVSKTVVKKVKGLKGGNKVSFVSPKLPLTKVPDLPKNGGIVLQNINTSIYDIDTLNKISSLENMVVGVASSSKKIKSLLASGEYVAIDTKIGVGASDWGPQLGFVPSDAYFSSKDERLLSKAFSHHVDNAINTGLAKEVPLVISDTRLVELKSMGVIENFSYDEVHSMYRGISHIDEKPVTLYYNKFREHGVDKWSVYSFNDNFFSEVNVLADAKTGKPYIEKGNIVSIVSDGTFSIRNESLGNYINWEEWRNTVTYTELSNEFKELYNNKLLFENLMASNVLSELSQLKKFDANIENGFGSAHGSFWAFDSSKSLVDIDYPVLFTVPQRMFEFNKLGDGIGAIDDYFRVDKNGLIIINNKDELVKFQQVVVNTLFTGKMSSVWGNKVEAFRAKKAKLTHAFLEARNEINTELGLNLDAYKPFYPDVNVDMKIDAGNGFYIDLNDYKYDLPVFSSVDIGDGSFIINNTDRVIVIDGNYYKASYDRLTNTNYIYDGNGNKVPVKNDGNGRWWFDESINMNCSLN
ncbi:CyaA/EF/ExoY family adenylyl cyclase toxin [Escherichia coli]|uniref:CyaA/EF/ExoY family adenylyl cyclase toxin n=1 Tax=Escherichia coli TaxID=562 RepID=UPI00215A9E21|nr:CyaA/EF/ExoY family adenylyl cyclase toxin [Escherichia coli]